MKTVLLIGLGRFGRHIAQRLISLEHEVMAIDIDEERVSAVADDVTSAVIGDCTKEEFLTTLGVRNFDVCIVAIGDNFQSSLETTSLLQELGAKKVVSRASSDVHAKFLLKNGADEIVYPEKQLAAWVAIRHTADHIMDYIQLDGEYSIFEVTVPEAWVEKTVGQIDIRKRYNINILAVKKDGKLFPNITPDTTLGNADTMLVLGTIQSIQKCFHI